MRKIVAILGLGLVVGLVAGGPASAGDSPAPVPAPASATDTIDEALASVGLTRADLGWRARGSWDRYPGDAPYRMRHVEDLFADPLATIPWLRSMGTEASTYLSPDGLATKGELGAGSLFRLVHDLGVHRRFGYTRPYSANLTAVSTPLADALAAAWRETGRSLHPVTFGKPADFPDVRTDLAVATGSVPADVGGIVGNLFLDLLDARRTVALAWRRTTLEARAAVFARLDIGLEETDALAYEPAIDDLAATWDEVSLSMGGLKVVEALDVARLALGALPSESRTGLQSAHLDVETPLGRVVVLGSGDDVLDVGSEGAFLVVDLGGNDRYKGSVAASSLTRGVGAMLELAGNDVYEAKDRALGCGMVGVGVLLDVAGNDRYTQSGTLGEGAGQFGLGVLADLAGDDAYDIAFSGQGCGFFGVGMLLDGAGADTYALSSDGQGFGGVAGVGVLADRGGDDKYQANLDPKVTGRPSSHSERRLPVSNCQGCGMGRRGDGSDGHSWAGGIGCLLDAEGDDVYSAANWCQGCGYWFGTGLLWDGAGNDQFLANGWAGGSGAHFCIGCLVDEAGDDLHRVTQNWGPGYGHDFTVGISCDLAGNDRYESTAGCGHSINRAVGILLDGGGDDTYVFAKPDQRPGMAPFDPRILDRSGKTPLYWTESTSVGLFVDAGGKDSYPAGFADGGTAVDAPGSNNARARHFGIAVDREGGHLDVVRPPARR